MKGYLLTPFVHASIANRICICEIAHVQGVSVSKQIIGYRLREGCAFDSLSGLANIVLCLEQRSTFCWIIIIFNLSKLSDANFLHVGFESYVYWISEV